jgi:hypothetical protein
MRQLELALMSLIMGGVLVGGDVDVSVGELRLESSTLMMLQLERGAMMVACPGGVR